MNRAKVQNPLTIIAIFAGIAEVAGTTVLLGLPLEVQRVFVWFVMIFPVALVSLFFVVLIFKHKVLYAPSDFSNEELFMQLIQKQQVISKANELVAEQALQVIEKPQNENSEEVNDFLGKLNMVLKEEDKNNTEYYNEIKEQMREGFFRQSILFLLQKNPDKSLPIREIHFAAQIPLNFLKRILRKMEIEGVIKMEGSNVKLIKNAQL